MDGILEYYDGKIGTSGLVENLGYWEPIDWQESWEKTCGRPVAAEEGALNDHQSDVRPGSFEGARIAEITGREGLAEEHRKRQKQIAEKVQKLCWDEERGLYREGLPTGSSASMPRAGRF